MNPRRDAEERLLWPTRWAAPRKAPLEFGPRDDRVERADRLRLYERMFDLPGPASSPNPDSPTSGEHPKRGESRPQRGRHRSFETRRQLQQHRLAPRPSEKGAADREPVNVADRHSDRRVTGDRRDRVASTKEAVTVHVIDQPRRRGRQRDERVE